MKTCRTCGHPFEHTHGAQRYCRPECKPVKTYEERRAYFNGKAKERTRAKRQGRACSCCGAMIPDNFSMKAKYCDKCRDSYAVKKMKKTPAPVAVWKCTKCGSDKRRVEGNSVYCGNCFWHENEVGRNVRRTNNKMNQQTELR